MPGWVGLPTWIEDFNEAEALGVKVWELSTLPLYWRTRAVLLHTAREHAQKRG